MLAMVRRSCASSQWIDLPCAESCLDPRNPVTRHTVGSAEKKSSDALPSHHLFGKLFFVAPLASSSLYFEYRHEVAKGKKKTKTKGSTETWEKKKADGIVVRSTLYPIGATCR